MGVLFHNSVLKELLFIWENVLSCSQLFSYFWLVTFKYLTATDQPSESLLMKLNSNLKMIGENQSTDIERNGNFSVKCFTENRSLSVH